MGPGLEQLSLTDYYNAAFRIMVYATSFNAWANPGNESFVDTRIEVDAAKNSGPDDNEFGVDLPVYGRKAVLFSGASAAMAITQ